MIINDRLTKPAEAEGASLVKRAVVWGYLQEGGGYWFLEPLDYQRHENKDILLPQTLPGTRCGEQAGSLMKFTRIGSLSNENWIFFSSLPWRVPD